MSGDIQVALAPIQETAFRIPTPKPVVEITVADNLHHKIEDLLKRIEAGDEAAKNQLGDLVYKEIHTIARSFVNPAKTPTLNPTALANEAWGKLSGSKTFPAKNRRYFFGAVAHAMRQILWDQDPRNGSFVELTTAIEKGITNSGIECLMDLHEAMEKLKEQTSEILTGLACGITMYC
jgi:hypothetical protein